MRDIVEVLRDEFEKYSGTDKARLYWGYTEETRYQKFVHTFAAENNIKLIGSLLDDRYWRTDGWQGHTPEDEVIFTLRYL